MEPQEVVQLETEAADGWFGFEAGMRAVPVVAMEPDRQLRASLFGVLVSDSIGPFAQRGLDEAFGLAIGLWRVRPREDMAQAEGFAGFSKSLRAIARAVVGHDTFEPYAEFRVIGHGGLEEGDGAFLLFVWQDLGEGDPRGIVDGNVDELPADAAAVALALSIAGDAMADLVETAQLF